MITKMEVFSSSASAPELQLAGDLAATDPIQIRNVEGIGPVSANIITTPYASGRGELKQGTSTGKRNIVLTLGFNPNFEGQTMATLRQMLYAYFMPENWCKLRFFTDYMPTCDIEGYVESFEPNIFSQDPEVQISIICPKPDFVEPDATIISGVVDNGTNEYVFDYVGTISTGFELKIESSEDNETYTGDILVVMKSPVVPQSFEVDPVTIDDTKYLKLSTVRNAKRIQNVAVADGVLTNLLSAMTAISVWPVLEPGENVLSVAAEEDGQNWSLAYFSRFGGL